MNSLPKFQEIKMNSVYCNNASHQDERIRSLCQSQECKQNSAQCYKCFRQFHVQCLNSIELEEIPKVLMELAQFITKISTLQEFINQHFKELIYAIEQKLQPITKYLEEPNLSNLEGIAQLLKGNPKQQIHQDCEQKIKTIKFLLEVQEPKPLSEQPKIINIRDISQLLQEHGPLRDEAQLCDLKSLINTNEKVQKTLERLGLYFYQEDHEDNECLLLPPYVQQFYKQQFKDGRVYEGQWKNHQRHGKGKQIWPDGFIYEGFWKYNRANGKGRLIHADGDAYVSIDLHKDGEWVDDRAQGHGTYHHVDGAKYEGEWLGDLKHGKGTEIQPDETIYTGCYVNGKKNGKGKYQWSDGATYDGDFKDDNIEGVGEYIWADGRKYKGQWVNNKMHGQGEFTWPDGKQIYSGQYVEDKKEGYGSLKSDDGRIYIGNWKNDQFHGKGILIDLLGNEIGGEWDEGEKIF